MPHISDTAYRRLKSNPSVKELNEAYTPNVFELVFAEERTREAAPRVGLLLLLKTFQRLGYFVALKEIPEPIVKHVVAIAGYSEAPTGLMAYDESSARRRHMVVVRDFLGVKAWDEQGAQIVAKACRQASISKDDLTDIINIAIEELIRERYELPAFITLHRAAQTARAEINRGYYQQVGDQLGAAAKEKLTKILTRPAYETQSQWDLLKTEPKQPTTRNMADFLDHLQWLGCVFRWM